MLSKTQMGKIRKRLKKGHNERLPAIFNGLGDPCRFFIFKLLLLQKEVCVTDIANVCEISVPAASQQLKVLELIGIVTKQRMGQTVCYGLKEHDPVIKALIKIIPFF